MRLKMLKRDGPYAAGLEIDMPGARAADMIARKVAAEIKPAKPAPKIEATVAMKEPVQAVPMDVPVNVPAPVPSPAILPPIQTAKAKSKPDKK